MNSSKSDMRIIGVDTGGTFTDLIFARRTEDGSDEFLVHKLLSTPSNPAEAVLQGLAALAPGKNRRVVHGSTVATNAILERKGVRTAFLTNEGFTDLLTIGRQNRSRLYDLHYAKEPPVVPKNLCFGIPGRILSDGSEREPLDEMYTYELSHTLRETGVESMAVCLLFSFANPAHERRVAEILAGLDLPVSLSHEILAEFREFERASTTVINAYVSPRMARYLTYLENGLESGDNLRIMQSNGGGISAETAMRESVRTILSGPAGGVVGAHTLGQLAGFEKLITFDMGGTSTDVSLIDGEPTLTLESQVAGFPVKTPMIDIHTVGAGGGSLAGRDRGGALTVGPESAGADPGPICYGIGERLTVTDANCYLGRIVPEHFLGGAMQLHPERVAPAMESLASEFSIPPVELAEGILAVANANMERALRVISVERGYNPRDFALFSFGGAGGLHAAYLARALSMPLVIMPPHPGILSAVGMLMADILKDYSQTVMLTADTNELEILGNLDDSFLPLEEKAREEMKREGVEAGDLVLERYLDMRYLGQSYEIITPYGPDMVETFHSLHERFYGYRNTDKAVQAVNLRLRARGTPPKPKILQRPLDAATPPSAASLGTRNVIFDGRPLETRIFQRELLQPGNRFQGPAVLVEYSSTLLIPPFASAEIDAWGNLLVRIEE